MISIHRIDRAPWIPVALAMFCCGWAGNQFSPLLVMYGELGGYSPVTVNAFFAAYVVGLVPGLLISGPLSDRHGRRPVLLAGTALSAAAGAVLALGVQGPLPLFAGRLLAGLAVGTAMAVGSSWVKELSGAPYEPAAEPGAGARRASVAITAGFGLGAGVAGVLAQWAPWPMVLPYSVQIVLTLPCLFLLRRAPQPPVRGRAGAFRSDLRVPSAGHPRFLRVVLPMAPWVFGAAALAYAVTPQLAAPRVGDWQLAFATLLTVVTLGSGVAVQPLAKRLDRVGSARAGLAGMALVVAGTLLCALNAGPRSLWASLLAAVVLGTAYSITMVAGLLEVQRIAPPHELARLTGVYYSLTYVGFLLPMTLSAASEVAGYPVLLTVVAVAAGGCLAVAAASSRRHLPRTPPPPVEPVPYQAVPPAQPRPTQNPTSVSGR
ncbi:MFS transporter [Streptomyces sp. NPDC055078]